MIKSQCYNSALALKCIQQYTQKLKFIKFKDVLRLAYVDQKSLHSNKIVCDVTLQHSVTWAAFRLIKYNP